MRIITLSREFGSGGRELARRLADELGLSYYDNEIIQEIAASENLDADYVARTLEKGIRWNMPIHYAHSFIPAPSSVGAPQLLAAQHNIILQLAPKGDCIIVGRAADVILREYNPFRIFVYADMEQKLARCRTHMRPDEVNMTDKEFEKRIKQVDKRRASSYSLVSDTPWGDRRGYDLCVNTTNFEIKEIAPLVAEFAKQHFENNGK